MADQMVIQFEPPRAGLNFQKIINTWSDEKLQEQVAVYERLVEVHSGRAKPIINPLTKKEFYQQPMKWMLPVYESALALIRQEIESRKEVSHA